MEIIFSSNGTVQSQYKLPVAQARKIEKIIKETLTEPMEKPKKITKAAFLKRFETALLHAKAVEEGTLPRNDIKKLLDEI